MKPARFSLLDYRQTMDDWLATNQDNGLLRQQASIQVYRDMWNSFAQWCASQHPPIAIDTLRLQDLTAFQASRSGAAGGVQGLSPRHARRLLGLIDRVLQHRAGNASTVPNMAAAEAIAAQPEVRYADAVGAQTLPVAFGTEEAGMLIGFVSRVRVRPGKPAEALPWQAVRNCVSVGLQLGAGLTPGEIRQLTLGSATERRDGRRSTGWMLAVPGNGNAPGHQTPVAPWAGELLRHWLQVRTTLAIPGDWLFPSTRTGKPWGKVAQYMAARQVLADAGLQDQEGGSFRLRHTFALRQLRRGTPADQVAQWLGVSDPGVMARYERVLGALADVV